MIARIVVLVVLMVFLTAIGCAKKGQSPQAKPEKLTPSQRAADAAKRFPYPSDAQGGGEAVARAQVGYMLNRLEVVNLTDEAWEDVEVWVNNAYVYHLPRMEPRTLKVIPFQSLYNDAGATFPTNNNRVRVQTVQLHYGGTLYDVPLRLAD